jgi:osmotically-inducible protein OsmY
MKTDTQLKHDVVAELDWDRAINATNIGVAVRDGVVTMSGHIDTSADKDAIERAVQRVEGVRAVAVELDVKLSPGHQRSDSEIAAAAESAFKWHALLPADKLKVRVEKGWVTLGGEVEWDYQRRNAESSVRALTGVVGVSNTIAIKPQVAPANVIGRIREALTRRAEREVRNIDASVSGSTVTLRGSVHTWAERAACEGAAWSAAGISKVVNELQVSP